MILGSDKRFTPRKTQVPCQRLYYPTPPRLRHRAGATKYSPAPYRLVCRVPIANAFRKKASEPPALGAGTWFDLLNLEALLDNMTTRMSKYRVIYLIDEEHSDKSGRFEQIILSHIQAGI